MPAADSPAARTGNGPGPHDWPARADLAARSVTRTFGQRLFFLPGTHFGAIVRPSTRFRSLFRPWHYWWQAHYVDCLVDAGGRELASGAKFDGAGRPSAGRLASRLVTTIRLRNFLRFINSYYDDMAWLALATLRLEELAEASRKPGRRRNAFVRKSLTLQFDSASTDELGGGTFWSTKRDFKNTPATAPVALYFARTGRPEQAQALLDWLDARLFDPARGLYLDGLRISGGEAILEDGVYTYNQGPVLGALLELGGEANLSRAAVLVDAIAKELTVPGHTSTEPTAPETEPGRFVIRGEGGGDGGLFTGILLRYVALAARDERLPDGTRAAARGLVTGTAEAFWAGRTERENGTLVFSPEPQRPAGETYPAGAAVELSTQLQAWMALEAAASLNR
ncbi:glycoside hydrolase family 76 protein [Arthrobacter cavernae]|uniref:Glycosyl hydrolase n=1 Tax=Arthrobacter cavernae TaxID=2817681 RepID=A0A939KNY6_9MICC|nr:glycoside hydrolase family 76 protein [Arthrobacter cavernae]MBO1269791.1 glycosyl hydrolase [Arthrobacter cavernae]